MLRTTFPILLVVLTTVSLYDIRLKADEPIHDSTNHREEEIVSFERLQFTISRHKGKIIFDGVAVPRHVLGNKSKELRLIEIFDGLQFPSDKSFIQWTHKLKGTRTYTYDVVHQVSADGTSVTQPLVFFNEEQRKDLDVKWHAWLNERQAEMEKANQIRLAEEQEAKRYQQMAYLQELQTKALVAQADAAEKSAESLAVISGATSLWEIELIPVEGSNTCVTCQPNFGGLALGSQFSGLSLFAIGNGVTSTFGSNLNYGKCLELHLCKCLWTHKPNRERSGFKLQPRLPRR